MSTTFAYSYRRLPVAPDEGFPQAFRLVVDDIGYTVTLQVTVLDEALLSAGVLELPLPGAYLVLTVQRDEPVAEQIFRRKLVPGLEYAAAELGLVATTMRVDPRNLNGHGRFGSEIVIGVTRRWAS
ncbi:hypothetical protein [Nocardia thraciensis]